MPRWEMMVLPLSRSIKQILGAAAKPDNGTARNLAFEILRKRKAQVAAAQLQLADARAFHRGGKTAFHRFDFWQFRHLNPSVFKRVSTADVVGYSASRPRISPASTDSLSSGLSLWWPHRFQ